MARFHPDEGESVLRALAVLESGMNEDNAAREALFGGDADYEQLVTVAAGLEWLAVELINRIAAHHEIEPYEQLADMATALREQFTSE